MLQNCFRRPMFSSLFSKMHDITVSDVLVVVPLPEDGPDAVVVVEPPLLRLSI